MTNDTRVIEWYNHKVADVTQRGNDYFCTICKLQVEIDRIMNVWIHIPIMPDTVAVDDAQARRKADTFGGPNLVHTILTDGINRDLMALERPDWDAYFMGIAEAVAQRATCPRAKCGAVIVSRDNRILATGYNGSTAGESHCFDVGCLVIDGHCQRTQHAEINAVAYAARYGVAVDDSRLYLWISGGATVDTTCRECAKVLRAAGVSFNG